MNADTIDLVETCNNRVFLPPNAMRMPAAPQTVMAAAYQTNNSKLSNAMENITNCELKLNNEFNTMPMAAANCATPAAATAGMGSYPQSFQGKLSEKSQERYVWEMRSRSPNVTPASTVLNSPDLNVEMQCSLQLNRQHQIRVGRSPGSQFEQQNILPQGLSSPGSPTDVGKAGGQCLRDGEIVVFDDIDTNWMNKSKNMQVLDNESVSFAAHQQRHHLEYLRQHQHNNNEDVLKVTKMIGQLPIAEYEGSPRRIGNNQSQSAKQANATPNTPNVFPKRPPGFPQRVSLISSAAASNASMPKDRNTRQTNLLPQQRQSLQNPQQQPQRDYSIQNQYYASTKIHHDATDEAVIDNNKRTIENLIDIDDDGCSGAARSALKAKTPTFDYLYEFSETRKVLEEFFKANPDDEKRFTDFTESGDDIGSCDYEREPDCVEEKHIDQAYVGQRLARIPKDELYLVHRSPKKQPCDNVFNEPNDIELYIDSNSRSSCDLADTELEANLRRHSRNFTLSPETTDYDSNCGDLDSLSNDINCQTDYGKLYTSMPVLEDGLSSGHASDTENNATNAEATERKKKKKYESDNEKDQSPTKNLEANDFNNASISPQLIAQPQQLQHHQHHHHHHHHHHDGSYCTDVGSSPIIEERLITDLIDVGKSMGCGELTQLNVDSGCCNPTNNMHELSNESSSNYDAVYAAPAAVLNVKQTSPSQRQTRLHEFEQQQQQQQTEKPDSATDIQEAMKEIRSALQRAKTQPEKLKFCDEVLPPGPESPIWVLRKNMQPNAANSNKMHVNLGAEDEEADTDLETDRLLGQQRLDEQSYFDDKSIWPKTSRISGDSNDQSPSTSDVTLLTSNSLSLKPQAFSSATIRQGIGTSLTPDSPERCQIVGSADVTLTSPEKLRFTKSPSGSIKSLKDSANSDKKAKSRNKEGLLEPAVLIEGVLFRARYLGSTQLVCEGQPTKSTRMMQAEEAVSRIKAPEGESQPSTEVDLFISTEKIMVLNTDLKEIMMDHALRTISYIADIGDLVVLMARRRFVPSDSSGAELSNTAATTSPTNELNGCTGGNNKENKDNCSNGSGGGSNGSNKHTNRTPKMICHVFESDEAQFIAQSIGQAFQVAYMEFLKANGIEDHSFVKEMDYQEVLNSQEIFGDELEIFAKKELQKEVVVPKAKGEILGVVIVESGWGSMLPTVVIANLMSSGAAARCGQLNIGDQLIAINGLSLVGLPLSTCQNYIRNAKNQTAVKFTVVPCPPVVEVKIKRPNTKYQLGFSVQNGVICSLLRGGIAERGGVRVGHRIIEINNQSVVAVPHEKIVNLLATSVGEILMKTMPTSMFRLLTGQENPIYI